MSLIRACKLALLSLLLVGSPFACSRSLIKPELIAVDGSYTHEGSNLTLPASYGEFRRTSLRRYDTKALDVSAGYDLVVATDQIAATVYVYPAPSITSILSPPEVIALARSLAANQEFQDRKQEIIRAHPSARLLSERDVPPPLDSIPLMGRVATFEFEDVFAGQSQELRSDLYLFSYVADKWIVKYRFTYATSSDASKRIEDFIRAGGGARAPGHAVPAALRHGRARQLRAALSRRPIPRDCRPLLPPPRLCALCVAARRGMARALAGAAAARHPLPRRLHPAQPALFAPADPRKDARG
jgi:hypothetical protein